VPVPANSWALPPACQQNGYFSLILKYFSQKMTQELVNTAFSHLRNIPVFTTTEDRNTGGTRAERGRSSTPTDASFLPLAGTQRTATSRATWGNTRQFTFKRRTATKKLM